jgi:hypothetical protein
MLDKPKKIGGIAILAIFLALLSGCAAQTGVSHHHAAGAGYEGKGSLFVSATFGPGGRLWRVVAAGNYVYVDHSGDLGKTFSVPVAVNAEAMKLRSSAENRPGIAVDAKGRVFVIFSAQSKQPATVFFSASTDGGVHFSTPFPVSDQADEASNYQATLAVSPPGNLFLFWHDERERTDWRQVGLPLYYAESDDPERLPARNSKIMDDMCECCRMAVAFDPAGLPVVFTRFVYAGGIRDHGLLRLSQDGKSWSAARVTHDDWQIKACPEQGPALSIAPNGTYHIVWFTQGNKRTGLFYARSADQGAHFGEPMQLGDAGRLASHGDVLSAGKKVALVWKEFDGAVTTIVGVVLSDDGGHWASAKVMARTNSEADFPFLVTDGKKIYLSWNSHDEGYRLIPME